VARTIASLHKWAYCISDEGVWVNIYGGSSLETELTDGSLLKLKQESLYPRDGQIKITMLETANRDFALMLRIPGWADGAEIRINGSAANVKTGAGTYAIIQREWASGDVVELTLPMEVRMIKAHPRVEEVRNHVAVMRGPVVYCLESADLPDGVEIDRVCIPRNAQLTPRYDPELLGGVTVLEGEARRVHKDERSDKLYRKFSDGSLEPVKIALIPYFAWANRGSSEMTVWMPLC